MYYLMLCLEDWVNSNPHPDFIEKLNDCSQNLLYNLYELIDDTIPSNSTNLIIEYPLDVVYQSVENAVNSGDNCRDLKGEDQVCSSDILSNEQKQQIDNIIANFSHLLEVRDEAQDNWDNMASKLHDIYVDMLTALVAMFTATAVVFSKTVVAAEQLLVGSIMAGLRNIISKRKVNSEQDEDKPDAAEEDEDAFYPSSWWLVGLRLSVRFAFLFLVILKFMFMAWDNLRKLDSSPQEGWTGTLHYQQDDMAFLVTTTSTIQLTHRSITITISKAILVPYILFVFLISCLHLHRNPLLRNCIILPSNYDLLIANHKQSSPKKSP